MDDKAIIDLFFERSEQAIRELDTKYGKTCHRVSYNILNNQQDAEECVNDAYLGTWNAVPPQRPNPLLTFLCQIVCNFSIMRYHANMATKRNSAYDTALGEVNEKYVTEAIEYSGTTKLVTRTHFQKALMIAAIITALWLLSAAAYAVIRYYSTAIENTTLYMV